MIKKRSYPDDPESVLKARRFIASTLHGLPVPLQEVVTLLVSELATNAVRHAGARFTVCIEVAHGVVRVEVTDPSAGMPTKRSPAPSDPGGRGLHIVDKLAPEWGVVPASPSGKTVWFRVPVPVSSRVSHSG